MLNIKSIVKSLVIPKKESHKGQNGRLLVIGGSAQYHGAPVFALNAAKRFVDLLYFLPAEDEGYLINAVKCIPEVIVVDHAINDWVDCILFGNGLGEAAFDLQQLKDAKKLVIDGDGLKRIKNAIPKGAILTPHEGEFAYLFNIKGTKENVKAMARKHECVILKKDHAGDIITDGERVFVNTMHNQGMTKGGTGDVLAGLVAALACKNPSFEACAAAAYINGYAAEILRKKVGFNFCASDLAEVLAEAYFKLKKS